MALEPILLRGYAEPDRDRAERETAAQVRANPELFIARYVADQRSFGGRYVAADLFKETIPAYSASPESRTRYNGPVHNSSAVLSSEQFRRVVDASQAGDRAVFLTGVPGAGKTSQVDGSHGLAQGTAVIFEGQLSRPEPAIPKIQHAIDRGLHPTIVVVHRLPEDALDGTLKRFHEIGRGSTISLMADIQGRLPDGLATIRERFADQVSLVVKDNRDPVRPSTLHGWHHLDILRSEGRHEEILARLGARLEDHRSRGLSDAGYAQATGRLSGQDAGQDIRGMAGPGRGGIQAPGDRRGVPQVAGEVPVLDRAERHAVARAYLAGDNQPQLDQARATESQLVALANAAGPRSPAAAAQIHDTIRSSITASLAHGRTPVVTPAIERDLQQRVSLANLADAFQEHRAHPERSVSLRAIDRERSIEAAQQIAERDPSRARAIAHRVGALDRTTDQPFATAPDLQSAYDQARVRNRVPDRGAGR